MNLKTYTTVTGQRIRYTTIIPIMREQGESVRSLWDRAKRASRTLQYENSIFPFNHQSPSEINIFPDETQPRWLWIE